MRRVLVVLMLMVVPAPLAFGQTGGNKSNSKIEQAVLKQMNNWLEALRRSDVAALDRIMADDFMLLAADGTIISKEQDTAPVKSGDVRFESLTTEGVKVFVYGDTAVVTGLGVYKVNYKGKASTIRERFFDVYQKRKGQWQVIASRPTPGEKSAG
jgi:ketosteroid isomerase-like protein